MPNFCPLITSDLKQASSYSGLRFGGGLLCRGLLAVDIYDLGLFSDSDDATELSIVALPNWSLPVRSLRPPRLCGAIIGINFL